MQLCCHTLNASAVGLTVIFRCRTLYLIISSKFWNGPFIRSFRFGCFHCSFLISQKKPENATVKTTKNWNCNTCNMCAYTKKGGKSTLYIYKEALLSTRNLFSNIATSLLEHTQSEIYKNTIFLKLRFSILWGFSHMKFEYRSEN